MNKRVRKLREDGLSKREAKRAVYGRVSQHKPNPAPLALYRRLRRHKVAA